MVICIGRRGRGEGKDPKSKASSCTTVRGSWYFKSFGPCGSHGVGQARGEVCQIASAGGWGAVGVLSPPYAQPMANESTNLAEIQVIQERTGPVLRVGVPRGSTLDVTVGLIPTINDILTDLTGCAPCNSGVPMEFFELPEVSSVVKVDLATMRKI